MINLGKTVDNVSKPKLLPEDWYLVEVIEAPEAKPNSKGTGDNWVLSVKTVGNPEPEYNGFRLPVFLPLPSEEDENEYVQGQSLFDQKADRLITWVKAFDGIIDGENLDIEAGAQAYVYIVQQMYREELTNSINIFGNPPKHVDEFAS